MGFRRRYEVKHTYVSQCTVGFCLRKGDRYSPYTDYGRKPVMGECDSPLRFSPLPTPYSRLPIPDILPPMTFGSLETPVPLVDLDRLEANLDRMAAHAAELGLALRPHVKTHKTQWIAGEQLRQGAVGVTCATTAEAEVMAGVTGDILLAHPPVHPRKLARLLALPEGVSPMVGLDSEEAIERLGLAARRRGREVRVMVELDLGMGRVGVQSPEDAVRLARRLDAETSLRYAGVMFYPGHIKGPLSEQGPALERLRNDLGAVLHVLERERLPATIVSGGSTPTAGRTGEVAGLTEMRPGTYVYNDRITVATGACSRNDCALTVLATVVSTAVPGQAVVDAGTKALGREPFGDLAGFGELLDRPEVVVRAMSEEHGMLDLSGTEWRPRVGEQVRIIPNHVCIVVHLNDLCVGVRGERVERSWPVAARGRKFEVRSVKFEV